MASVSISCPASCSATDGVVRNGKSPPDAAHLRRGALTRITWGQSTGGGWGVPGRIGRWPQHDFTSWGRGRKKPQAAVRLTSRKCHSRVSDVIVCAEMDERWGRGGGAKRARWLFYALRLGGLCELVRWGGGALGRLCEGAGTFDVVKYGCKYAGCMRPFA